MTISAHILAAKPEEAQVPSVRSACEALTFEEVYAQGFRHVVRWIRALGGRDADLEDLAQETFVIVRRQLPKFDGNNLAGFLYRITQRTVRDYREGAWFRRSVANEPDDSRAQRESTTAPPNPCEVVERRESLRVLTGLLATMSETHRTAFILFEVEGYSGEEIAQLEDIPVNTVWTRLHHARRELYTLVAQARAEGRLP
jgi:RNA polymerase sigma-70 factor (ECF subfamily)